ncbi:hypothetical protein EUTSA_v10012022mg, partial [Eutrema salsugineum]
RPPMMYTLDDISCIASAIGDPLYTKKSRLDLVNIGETKVKVEIMLDSSPPSTIIVRDTEGNSARVSVTYPRLPPKCSNCSKFGHLLNRCPKALQKKNRLPTLNLLAAPLNPPPTDPPSVQGKDPFASKINKKTKSRARSRSRTKSYPLVTSDIPPPEISNDTADQILIARWS